MRKSIDPVAAIGTVVLSIMFVANLRRDLRHPELWCDWMHDPRIYVPYAIVLFGGLLVWWRRIEAQAARWRAMLDVINAWMRRGGERKAMRRLISFTVPTRRTAKRNKTGS